MASALQNEPPGPDVNAAPKLLSITGALYIVVVLLFGGRICTRFRYRQLGWDDFAISFALVLALLEFALLLVAVHYGTGHHNYYVHPPKIVHAQHFLFASTLPWAPSIMFIKISIAAMLLRIKHDSPWRIFLWTMITVQILSCFASLLFQMIQCVPLSYMWDPISHPDAVCARPDAAYVSLYVNSAIGITTDLIFAIVPISFVRKMNVPPREMVVLLALMGLGIFAAAASIVKTTLVKNYGRTGDALWDAVPLTLWSVLEEQIGMIAACIPCLKSPFERTLHGCGILSIRKGSTGYEHHSGSQPANVSHQLPPLRVSLTRGIFGHAPSLGLGLDTNVSSSLGCTTLGGKSSVSRSITAPSQETIWPDEPQDEETDEGFRQMMAEGGILLTTEFQIKSEALSRASSMRSGEKGIMERQKEREREMEEWRVERLSCEGKAQGWDIV